MQGLKPDTSYIYNTDFLAAIRKNKRNCIFLVLFLLLILGSLAYLLGWYIELNSMMYTSGQKYNHYGSDQYTFHKNRLLDTYFNISRTGLTFALIAIVIGILWSTIAMVAGSKIILFSANAREISHQDSDYPILTNVVQEMSVAAGITPPKTYIIETPELNAFATGMSPSNAAVAITRGLLQKLNRDELQGVIAHEIGHVINYDIRYQTFVSIIVGLIVLLSDIAMRIVFYSGAGRQNRRSSNDNRDNGNAAGIIGLVLIVFTIIAPIAAIILQMAVSRQREYMADATSVKLTRNPLGLISALGKLSHAKPFDGASKSNQNLFIVNPFRNVAKLKSNLLATHPPLEDRIARLKNLQK